MYLLFHEALLKNPLSTAIVLSNQKELTYLESEQIVSAWVRYFNSFGLKAGDKVVLMTESEDLHVFVYLALSFLHLIYIPIGIQQPIKQLQVELKKIKPDKIFLDERLTAKFSNQPDKLVSLNHQGVSPAVDTLSVITEPYSSDSRHISYIVGSSGSSGARKFIPIAADGIHYWAEVERALLQLSTLDRVLCTMGPDYDARISEYMRAFSAGCTLYLLSANERRDFNCLVNRCSQNKITCLILIASQLDAIDLSAVLEKLSASGLKHLMVTGDTCTWRLKTLCEKFEISLWNCYGPTEATFGFSILRVNGLSFGSGDKTVPIGKPYGKEVSYHIDEEGCLLIDSPYLTSGYVGSAELTKKMFPNIINPQGESRRCFNTENKFSDRGDHLLFQGRINDEAHCKVTGVKIYALAIEQRIKSYNDFMQEDMIQACVVVKPWRDRVKPFAYVVSLKKINKAHFRLYLNENLASEEIPIIIEVSALPLLLPSKKIDRRGLVGRTDHPDDFFFSEGAKSGVKFSAKGLGLHESEIMKIDSLIAHLSTLQADEYPDNFVKQIDEIVLGANKIDQQIGLETEISQTKVILWLESAYNITIKYNPRFSHLLTGLVTVNLFDSFKINELSCFAQLLHYYAKAMRYRKVPEKQRIRLLLLAAAMSDYLDERKDEQDYHAFQGRSFTYYTAVMHCLFDSGQISQAILLAKKQIALAEAVEEIFHIIQFSTHLANLYLVTHELDLVAHYARQGLSLSSKFYYQKHVIYFNSVLLNMKYYQQLGDMTKAIEYAKEIKDCHQADTKCGVKFRHLNEANNLLLEHDKDHILKSLWCKALDIIDCDADEEFVFLGGDSFLLNYLVAEIRKNIEPHYSLQKVFELPAITLNLVRQSLFQVVEVDVSTLMVKPLVKPKPKKKNYFILPPLLGEGYFSYRNIAKEFSRKNDCNCYGLSDPSIFNEDLLPTSFTQIVERYLAAIKSIQADGPYYLLGFSYGGTLAYLVAERLMGQGEIIRDLQIIDGFAPAMYQSLHPSAHAVLLQDLLKFMIENLNNTFFSETINNSMAIATTSELEKLSVDKQVALGFSLVAEHLRNPASKRVLALARRHLELLLAVKELKKLPLFVRLHLSSPNQTYLSCIFSIERMVPASPECQYYFWSVLFKEVLLSGKRPEIGHL